MKGWRLLFSVGIFILLIAATFLLRSRTPKPTYQGKTGEQWFREFFAASEHYRVPLIARDPSGPSPASVTTTWTIDVDRWERDPAADALRALGTNAALYFGEQVRRRDSIWATPYRKLFFTRPAPLRAVAPYPPVPRDMVRSDLAFALTLLGTNAAPALPALIDSLTDCGPYSRQQVIGAVRQLPFNREDLNPVLEKLRGTGQLANGLCCVAELGIRTPTAARLLRDALSAPDLSIRRSAASQLQYFGPEAVVALPALARALTDNDQELRYNAAVALETLGPKAQPAVPSLIQATNDTSVMVRRAATRALQKITSSPPAVKGSDP